MRSQRTDIARGAHLRRRFQGELELAQALAEKSAFELAHVRATHAEEAAQLEFEAEELRRRVGGLERALAVAEEADGPETVQSLADEVQGAAAGAEGEAAIARAERLDAELADVREQLAAREALLTRVMEHLKAEAVAAADAGRERSASTTENADVLWGGSEAGDEPPRPVGEGRGRQDFESLLADFDDEAARRESAIGRLNEELRKARVRSAQPPASPVAQLTVAVQTGPDPRAREGARNSQYGRTRRCAPATVGAARRHGARRGGRRVLG